MVCVLSGLKNIQSTVDPSESRFYIFCGISPSPQLKTKFKKQHVDKLHENYFIYNSFGPDEKCYHKNFKALFACQKTLVKYPPKTQFTNWKVQPLLMWIEFIFPLIWIIGLTFYLNEITMSFKVRHADKISMTYKAEGGGLQTDNIFHKGYKYQIFLWDDPVSKYIYI